MGSAAITRDSIVTISKDQISCDMGGERAILNSTSGVYFGLDGVGGRVWDLIQKPTSVKEVLEILLKEYDVEPAHCERDLLELMQQLAAKGLVEIADVPGA